jgi:hypothetical protein
LARDTEPVAQPLTDSESDAQLLRVQRPVRLLHYLDAHANAVDTTTVVGDFATQISETHQRSVSVDNQMRPSATRRLRPVGDGTSSCAVLGRRSVVNDMLWHERLSMPIIPSFLVLQK